MERRRLAPRSSMWGHSRFRRYLDYVMTAKADIVEAYFARWQDDLDRAKDLLADQKYYLEAWLVLSCYLGAFALLRFPTLRDTEAYKGVVLQYSDMKDFYEQIDLLF